MPTIDLQAEARLDDEIRPLAPIVPRPASGCVALLTGATGYLGSYLLVELLEQTTDQALCLVRANGDTQAQARLLAVLDGLGKRELENRVKAIAGDFAKPSFGLSEQRYRELVNQIDYVCHNGAAVNHVFAYPLLKEANVTGMINVIRFASEIRTKQLYYTSTAAVLRQPGRTDSVVIPEDVDITGLQPASGYGQTKWVAERLLATARERGLATVMFRPSAITGDSRTGQAPVDARWLLVRESIELGRVPDVRMMLDMTPVDYMAKVMVRVIKTPSLLGKTFHPVNQVRMSWQDAVGVLRAIGYELETVSYDAWREAIATRAVSQTASRHELAARLLFKNPAHHGWMFVDMILDDRNVAAAIEGTGIACPPLDAALFRRYVEAFIQNGVLKKPGLRSGG